MEFGEKLQSLRKGKGLTQEELAQALYVSRTAVSKWESGRGYPGIDSLKEISGYFSVSIDDLLSGEKLISIAEKERAESVRSVCGRLSGAADLLAFLLIVLPLYPMEAEGYVYAVSLMRHAQTSAMNRAVYWALFVLLMAAGAVKLLTARRETPRAQRAASAFSMALGSAAVLYLALAGETYATAVAFLLLAIKGALLYRQAKA